MLNSDIMATVFSLCVQYCVVRTRKGRNFMMNSTCPYCGAETRPGDNFCLNCGNRLLPATSSPQQQAQPATGDATIPAQEGWMQAPQGQGSAPAPAPSVPSWSDPAAMTIASTSAEPPTIRSEPPNP